jgi:UDP-N-acetylmuramyl tripeptide synthase
MNLLITIIGKSVSKISSLLNLGHGSTWPGHIALKLNSNYIQEKLQASNTKIILVSGTNGKTTTAKLIQTILEGNHKSVASNISGANLLNGIASSLILTGGLFGSFNYDYAIFEVDENSLPNTILAIEPDYLIALNLFRDQLDRYGEIDSISAKWKKAYSSLKKTNLILNADDPQIAFLGKESNLKTYYFGLNDKLIEYKVHQHASDSILCPNCGAKLNFDAFYLSHLGIWNCPDCKFSRPKLDISNFSFNPLNGTYSSYDLLAAVMLARIVGLKDNQIETSLKNFKPAFGRQEEIISNGKKVQLYLSKNPTSFNESLKTIVGLNAKNLLIVLNDNIPDGKDISWIWDADFEILVKAKMNIFISGIRVNDLSIRMKYALIKLNQNCINENLKNAIKISLNNTDKNEILYILPTYSAMLEARKILTGKEIL